MYFWLKKLASYEASQSLFVWSDWGGARIWPHSENYVLHSSVLSERMKTVAQVLFITEQFPLPSSVFNQELLIFSWQACSEMSGCWSQQPDISEGKRICNALKSIANSFAITCNDTECGNAVKHVHHIIILTASFHKFHLQRELRACQWRQAM